MLGSKSDKTRLPFPKWLKIQESIRLRNQKNKYIAKRKAKNLQKRLDAMPHIVASMRESPLSLLADGIKEEPVTEFQSYIGKPLNMRTYVAVLIPKEIVKVLSLEPKTILLVAIKKASEQEIEEYHKQC